MWRACYGVLEGALAMACLLWRPRGRACHGVLRGALEGVLAMASY